MVHHEKHLQSQVLFLLYSTLYNLRRISHLYGGIKQFVMWVHTDSGLSFPEQKTLLQKIKDILNAIALKLREWVKGKDFTGSESMLSMAINADGSNPFASMIHETAEYAEVFNATGMKKVQDVLIQWQLSKNGGGLTLRDYVKSYQDSYQEKVGEKLSYGEALKEITNDALGGLFSTDSGVKKFTLWVKRDSNLSANEQVSVFRKIADILNAIAEKIRNFIKGTRSSGAETMLTTEERTILEGEEEFAKKLMNMFLDEADIAIENRNSATVNENAAEKVNSGELVRIKRRNIQSSEVTSLIDAHYRKNVSSYNAIIAEKNNVVKRDYMQNEKNNSKGENKYNRPCKRYFEYADRIFRGKTEKSGRT